MRSYEHIRPVFDQLLKKGGSSPRRVSVIIKLPFPGDTSSGGWKLRYLEGFLNHFKRIGGAVEVVNCESQNEESEDDGFEEE